MGELYFPPKFPRKPQPQPPPAAVPVTSITAGELPYLQDLLTSFAISDWDYVLVGDGSGSGWDKECGWACCMFEKGLTGHIEKTIWHGGLNRGTVNIGEIMAYTVPLVWATTRVADAKQPRLVVKVHVFSDSQYVVNTGKIARTSGLRGKNYPLWAIFRALHQTGFLLYWHWIRRETNLFNMQADNLSRSTRVLLKTSKLSTELAPLMGEPEQQETEA